MSSIIDERVVSMQFDNSEFERNVKTSMDTIDQLNSKLSGLTSQDFTGAFSGISEEASKIDLSGIATAATAIKDGLSAMEIVGIAALSRLTNSLINFGNKLWSISFGQMKSGGMARALNIQQAEFMLKGLGLDVKQVKEDAMFAVEDTAYGFDEAARAAASFGASGVKAGDDMKGALLGVSGVAAMTGRSYSDIANIFTTIASNGKLMTMQLRQFSASGLNVTAALAKQMGKTEAQINEMVTKGQIDFKTFAKYMNEAFGEHAKEANNTFQGAMSNVKAALSRIGAEFATPITTDMIPVFNALKAALNEVKASLKPAISDFQVFSKIFSTALVNWLEFINKSGAITNIIVGLRYGLMALINIIVTVSEAVHEVFPEFNGLSDLFRKIMLQLIPSEEALAGFKEVLKAVLIVARIATIVIGKFLEIVLSSGLLLKHAAGGMFVFAAGIKETIDPIIEFINNTKLFDTLIRTVASGVYTAIMLLGYLKGGIDNIANSQNIIEFVLKFQSGLNMLAEGFKTLLSNVNWTSVAMIAFVTTLVFLVEFLRQQMVLKFKAFVGPMGMLKKGFDGIMNSFSNFAGVLRSTIGYINKMKFGIMADILVKFAVSIAIISGSMALLASIPSDDLIKAGIAMAFVAGTLVILLSYLNKIIESTATVKLGATTKILALGAMMIALGAAFSILSVAMKGMGSMTPKEILKGVLSLYAIAGLFVAISHLAGTAKIPGLISFSIGALLMSRAVSTLAEIDNNKIAGATLALMGIMTAAGIAILLATIIPISFKALDFLAFGAMISMLVAPLLVLASMDQADLDKGLNAMTQICKIVSKAIAASLLSFAIKPGGFLNLSVLIATLTACVYSFKYMDDAAVDRGLKALKGMSRIVTYMQFMSGILLPMRPVGFTIFAAVLAILSGTMGYLSKLDPKGVQMAMESMVWLALLVSGMAYVSTLIKTSEDSIDPKAFIRLGLSLVTMAAATKLISTIPDANTLENAFFAVVALSAIITIMGVISSKITTEESTLDPKAFIQLGLSVILLSAAVTLLANNLKTEDDIWKMYSAVIAVSLLVSALIVAMNMVNEDKFSNAVKGLVTLAAGTLILTGSVLLLTLVPWDKALVAAGVIALLALSLAAANNLLSANYEKANGFAIMAASIAGLSLIVAFLTRMDTAKLLVAAGVITLLALAMGVVSSIMANFGTGQLDKALGFVALSAGLMIMAGSLYVLSNVPWDALLRGAGVLALLAAVMLALGAVAGIPLVSSGLLILSGVLLAFGVTLLMIAKSITDIAESFDKFTVTMQIWGNTATETIDLAIFNLNRFIQGLGSVAQSIIDIAPIWANAFSVIGLEIAAVVGSIMISVASYGGLGVLLFARSILTELPEILDTLATAMDVMGLFFENNKDRVYDFGFQIGKVLCDGILGGMAGIGASIWDKLYGDTMKEEAARKAADVADHVSQTMVKNMDMYLSGEITAEQMVAGLKKGLENGMYSVEDVNRELAARGLQAYKDEIGIHSPAKDYIESAEFSWKGLIEGVRNGEIEWQDVMASFGEMGVEAFKEKFNADDLLGGTLNFLNGGKDYTRIANQMVWNDEGSLEEAWRVAGYRNASDYASYLESMAQEKQMQDLLGRVASHFGVSIDELNAKFDEEIPTDFADALGDVSDAAGSASKQTDELADSIKDALDVFTKFNEEATLTGREVLQTFITQIRGVNTWQKEIQALGERGLNANFLQELADAGPDAYEKIHALYSMTEDELNLFNRMYAHKIVLERGTAKTIRDSFVQNGVMTVEAAKKFGENIADGAANKVAESGEKIKKSEQKALDEAAEELEKQRIDEEFVAKWVGTVESPETTMTLANAFTKLGYESMDALQKSTNFEVIMDKLILFKTSLKEQLKGGLNLFDEVKEEEEKDKITATKLLDNMEENLKRVGGWSYNLRKMIKMGFSEGLVEELRQAGPESADKVEAFVKMTANEMAIANRYYAESTSLPDQLADRMVSAYADAGFTVSLGLKKGLEDGKDDLILQAEETGIGVAEGYVKGIDPDAANDVMKQLGSKSLSALKEELDSHSPSKKAEQIGIWFVEGFTLKEQMDWALRTIANTMGKFADTAIDTLSEKLSGNKTIEIARSFIQGFDIGIKKYSNVVGKSVGEVGNNIVKSFASALGVASPSVIAEEIMGYFLEGAMKPLTDDTTVAEAAKSQAMVIADMFKEGITEDMDGDVYSPTIRPVWDDSNIANGLIGLNNGLTGLSLSGTINTANSANRTGPSQDAVMITNAINNLYNEQRIIRGEINSLNSNVSTLGSRIDGMYVRLDGNALVGQIVSPMDKAMGKKVVTQKRGRV